MEYQRVYFSDIWYHALLADGVIAPNLPDRQFGAEGPNKNWESDFIDLWTAEGRLSVAAVIDLLLTCRCAGRGYRPRGEVSSDIFDGIERFDNAVRP